MPEYQKIGNREIRGWAVMACGDLAPHDAHSWALRYTVYGPYACPGVIVVHEGSANPYA
jgi:hypothetical protein